MRFFSIFFFNFTRVSFFHLQHHYLEVIGGKRIACTKMAAIHIHGIYIYISTKYITYIKNKYRNE